MKFPEMRRFQQLLGAHARIFPQMAALRNSPLRGAQAGRCGLRAEQACRQTDAVWMISEGVVAEDIAEGQLALLPVDTSETTGPVGLTTRTDTTQSLAATTFMQAVRDVAAGQR